MLLPLRACCLLAGGCHWLLASQCLLAADVPKIDVLPASAKYLLLDARVVERTEGVRLAVGTARKHPANPLFAEDRPWEARFDNLYPNVIFDPDEKIYKCWYSPFLVDPACAATPRERRTPGTYLRALRASGQERQMGVCYAVSHDGLRWTKPDMELRLWDDGQRTNILDRGPHGAGVFKDPCETDPARRYKMIFSEGGVAVAFSPDGLRWSDPVACPEVNAVADTHNNAFWAPELGKYVAITRLWDRRTGERLVGRAESADFVHWTKAVEVLRGADATRQVYAMPVFRHADVYLGLCVIFDTRTDRSHTELAWSPDTFHWRRIDPGRPLIATSQRPGDCDWGCVYAAACPVVCKDEIRLYYGASNRSHGDWRDGFLALATLRPDGWAGYEPAEPAATGVVLTRPFPCPAGPPRITADAAGGVVRVAILDAAGEPLATAAPITTNVTAQPLRLPPGFDPAAHQGKPIRLRLEIERAKVYGFE